MLYYPLTKHVYIPFIVHIYVSFLNFHPANGMTRLTRLLTVLCSQEVKRYLDTFSRRRLVTYGSVLKSDWTVSIVAGYLN